MQRTEHLYCLRDAGRIESIGRFVTRTGETIELGRCRFDSDISGFRWTDSGWKPVFSCHYDRDRKANVIKLIGNSSGTQPYTEAEIDVELQHIYAKAYHSRSNMQNRNPDEAIADYSKVIEINPRDAEAYYSRGVELGRKGDLDGAIADYTKAIEINPRFAVAYYNRGTARDDKGDLDGALADFTEAIEIDPQDAVAYAVRGLTKLKQSKDMEAQLDIDTALKLNSSLGLKSFVDLASAKIKQARRAFEQESLRGSTMRHQDELNAWEMIHILYWGDSEEKVRVLTKAVFALLMEVEALREAMVEESKTKGIEPKDSVYGRAYYRTALLTHDAAGPIGGIDKLLLLWFSTRTTDYGITLREALMLARLGFSAEEISQYAKEAIKYELRD